MLYERTRKQHGIPRDPATYRWWRRNNAITWKGVPTKQMKVPELVRDAKGQVNFSKKQIRSEDIHPTTTG